MKWTNWMMTGLAVTLAASCANTDEPTDVEVSTSQDELATHFSAAGKADGQDVRKLSDGRVVFYGDVAKELAALGNVSPDTNSTTSGGVTYAQSPFAYCAYNDSEAACISYLPGAEVSGDSLVFGGPRGSSIDANKAYRLLLTMYYGGYDETSNPPMIDFTKAGSPLSCAYSSANVECAVSPNSMTGSELVVRFDALPELGDGFVYEGWLIVDGAPISAGRFDAQDEFVFGFADDVSHASAYILTIEPAVGDDPAPSATHIIGGDIVNGEATLTTAFGGALGTDFSDASGMFILAAPSAMDDTGAFDDKGIWYLDPTGPSPTLDLPNLGDGWAYEGWVVTENGPISTGRFTSPMGADSDGAGPDAGPGMTPPFPGQDFVNPPLSLPGHVAVISVEPEPDDSPAPFAIKPLLGMIEDAGVGVLQDLDLNGEALPMGEATLR